MLPPEGVLAGTAGLPGTAGVAGPTQALPPARVHTSEVADDVKVRTPSCLEVKQNWDGWDGFQCRSPQRARLGKLQCSGGATSMCA